MIECERIDESMLRSQNLRSEGMLERKIGGARRGKAAKSVTEEIGDCCTTKALPGPGGSGLVAR